MDSYEFVQRCRPVRDLRVGDAAVFLRLAGEAFRETAWLNVDDEQFMADDSTVKRLMEREKSRESRYERFGLAWIVKSASGEPALLVKVIVGGDEYALNSFSISFWGRMDFPTLEFFRKSIRIVRPYEAFVEEEKNGDEIRALLRERRNPSSKSEVKWIRWFHYLDADMAETLGGMAHCLATPAVRIEPLCDGLLLQLTDSPRSLHSDAGRRIQLAAMEHLGLILST